jgi:hypothetical protein
MFRVDPDDGGRAETVNIPIPYTQDTCTACKPTITYVVNDANFNVIFNNFNLLHTQKLNKTILILIDT